MHYGNPYHGTFICIATGIINCFLSRVSKKVQFFSLLRNYIDHSANCSRSSSSVAGIMLRPEEDKSESNREHSTLLEFVDQKGKQTIIIQGDKNQD